MRKVLSVNIAAVGVSALLLTDCAWVADLGPPRKPLERGENGGQAGDEPDNAAGDGVVGGRGDAGNAGAASSTGGDGSDSPDDPAVGRLLGANGRVCTASLVGPHSVLTSASCLSTITMECAIRDMAMTDASFILPGDDAHRFQVRGVAAFPQAYPRTPPINCGTGCGIETGHSQSGLRRSRDVALVYVEDDERGLTPAEVARPLGVVTNVGSPASVGEPAPPSTATRVYIDLTRDFRRGSTIEPLIVGYGSSANVASSERAQHASGQFDLGAYWNTSCEQTPRCGVTTDLRNRCPIIPFTAGLDFFPDRALRILDVAQEEWVADASGSPLFVTEPAPAGSLSTLQGGRTNIFGVVSGVEAATSPDAERVAAYAAPTFLDDTGGWLAQRLTDFDGDCIEDNQDNDPTSPSDPSGCRLEPAEGWSWTSLEGSISPPSPLPATWLHQGAPAALIPEGGRVELFVVAVDGVLYRAQGTGDPHQEIAWGGWEAVVVGADLRGELSVTELRGRAEVLALTSSGELRLFSIDRSGDVIQKPSPPTPAGGFTSPPSLVRTPWPPFNDTEKLDAFIRGSGGELLQLRFRNGDWLPAHTVALAITSAPSAMLAPNGNAIELFARSRDFRLNYWNVTGDTGPRWVPLDLGPIEEVPVGVATSVDQLDLLKRDASGNVFHRRRIGATWGNWQAVERPARSMVSVVAPANQTLLAFAFGEDDSLFSLRYAR